MNPYTKMSCTFTVEEWAMICKGILSMAASVNFDEFPDKDVKTMQYLILRCNNFYNELIEQSFVEK